MEHLDQFEDFWREELEAFESEPDDKEWEAIRDRLHPKRRMIPLWWLVPLAAALVGVGVFRQLSQPDNQLKATDSHIPIQTITTTKDIISSKATQEQQRLEQMTNPNSTSVTKSNNANNPILNQEKTTNRQEVNRIGVEKHLITSNNYSNVVTNNNATQQRISTKDSLLKENENSSAMANAERRQKESTMNPLPTKIIALIPQQANTIFEPALEKVNDWASIKEPSVKKQNKRKGLYFGLGTSLNLRNISPIKTDDFAMTQVQLPSLTSSNRIGWQASIGYKLPIRNRLVWRSSLQYQGFIAKLDYRLKLPEIEDIETSAQVSNAGLSLRYEQINLKQTDKNEHYLYHNMSWNNELGGSINDKNALYIGASLGKMLSTNGVSAALNATYSHRFKYFAIEPYFQHHLKYYTSKEPIYTFQPYAIGVNFIF
jgi:hypothetical protein